MSKNKGKTAEELLQEALVPVEEQPYKVPNNWSVVKLKNVCAYIQRGKSPKYADDIKEIPVISQKCVQWSGFDISKARFIDPNTINSYQPERLLQDYDILWNSTGEGTIGRVALYRTKAANYKTVVADSHVTIVRSDKGILDPRFLYYWLSSPFIQKYSIDQSISGTTKQTELSTNAIKEMLCFVPPLFEQKRISDKVETLLNKINQAKQLIEEAKETFELRRAAILDKAFRGELTASWRMENNVGFNWELIKLGELVKNGPQNGLYKPKDAYGDGTLIVRIDSFYNGEIKEWGTLKRLHLEDNEINLYGLENDDVIINRVNSIEYLGKSALVRNLIEPAVFESNVMRIKLNDKIIPEFLILYLNSFKGLEELRKNAKHAVNQASINQQDVKNVTVPLPTKKEQIEIIRMLNTILNKEKGAVEGIDLMEKVNCLENSILSKAFRGELGTNVSTDESAASLLINSLQE